MAKRKIFIIIGVIILSGIIGWIGCYLWGNNGQKKQDIAGDSNPNAMQEGVLEKIEKITPQARVSTEGWKTCRNEEYGYEFKYPKEWKLYGGGADHSTVDFGEKISPSEKCEGVTVEVADREQQHVADSVDTLRILSVLSIDVPNDFFHIHSIIYRMAGKVTKRDLKDSKLIWVYGDKEYSVSYENSSDYYLNEKDISLQEQEDEALFETILSTFQFYSVP